MTISPTQSTARQKRRCHAAPLIVMMLMVWIMTPQVMAQSRVIHVLVALCDNRYQGIVPVPAGLGDGQNPESNLYWGAGYGVKTFFRKQPDWKLVDTQRNPASDILERVIFRHTRKDVYLVADAYDGRAIRQATQDLYDYSAGRKVVTIETGRHALMAGGRADLLIYVGHNGLMDFQLPLPSPPANEQQPLQGERQAAVLACKSRQYFSTPLEHTGISPALLTTQLMAPEAYVVQALVNGWIAGEKPEQIRQRAATAYSRYQKLKKPALSLFSTRYEDKP